MTVASVLDTPAKFSSNCPPLLHVEAGALHVTRADARPLVLHPTWLRERLPDPRVIDPLTGQRLMEAAELPADLSILSISPEGRLCFSDGFETHLPPDWLARVMPPRPVTQPVLWDGSLSLPEPVAFAAMCTPAQAGETGNPALAAFLDRLATYGFAVVGGVPTDMDGALEFARLIGPIRITNWGGLADVRAIAQAYDLTMTPRHLEPHSDNPYREPVPGHILLHCLANDATGGESTLVDGFHAAAMLRATNPQAFDILTRTEVLFRYHDATTLLESRAPLIALDGAGEVKQVRYSNRTEYIDALPPQILDRYYVARQAFWDLIRPDSALTLRFKLGPGELLMMDNYRLFHGRTGYRLETGSRHMRQCYMDRDTVASRRDTLCHAPNP